MQTRLRIATLMALATLLLVSYPCREAEAQISNGNTATFQERLVSGLRARTPKEKAFLNALVIKVNRGEIPQQLVDNTFFYVRSRYRKHKFPFFYFERILRLRADKLHITIPPYTHTINQ